jgi:hypothetical protein
MFQPEIKKGKPGIQLFNSFYLNVISKIIFAKVFVDLKTLSILAP